MLRISLRSLAGDPPTVLLARCVRFCGDGTLRGSDNSVIAHRVDSCWKLGGKLHREVECEGPVRVRLTTPGHGAAVVLGPFGHLRTGSGMLHGDDTCLNIAVPGSDPRQPLDARVLTLYDDRNRNDED